MATTAPVASAQEASLRLVRAVPLEASISEQVLTPWLETVERESGGRISVIQVEAPRETRVADHEDGDLVWIAIERAPGRFLPTDIFELPFLARGGEATSRALHDYCTRHCADVIEGMRVIAWHAPGPGLLHSSAPLRTPDDLAGLGIRTDGRGAALIVSALDAEPIGLPDSAVAEALERGIVSGATWLRDSGPRLAGLFDNHTGFAGGTGLSTRIFVLAMREASYDALADELKAVIDDHSGAATAAAFGRAMDAADAALIEALRDAGGEIAALGEEETARWIEAAEPVIAEWIADREAQGIEAATLLEEARGLMAGDDTDE